jgi:NAD(P)H-flavin reductase
VGESSATRAGDESGMSLTLRVTREQKHTPQISSFFMTAENAARPAFSAGQVAILETEGHKPTYIAFAAAPEDEGFEFLIKRGSTPNAASALFEGNAQQVQLKEIVGRGFPVAAHQGSDMVFVAMGTGLAPLRATLRHVLRQRESYGRLIVLYGARKAADFCYQDEMQNEWVARGVELRQVLSQPDASWSGPTGYVQSLLDNLIPELTNPVALVCGSQEMMAQTKERLLALGFAAEKILTNY